MGSSTPPKRMTRSRAAAASAAAATLGTQVTKSDKVSKATKASNATKATAASAKKAVAKKPAAAKKSTAAKKPTTAKKPVVPKKPAVKATANTTATASTSTSTSASTSIATTRPTTRNTTRPTTMKRKLRTFDSDDDDDEDDLSKDDRPQTNMNRPAKKLRGSAKKVVDPESESESEPESVPRSKQPQPKEKGAQSTTTLPVTRATRGRPKSTANNTIASAVGTQTSSAISRTRKRKTATEDEDDDVATTSKQPVAKTTRGRKATGTVTTSYTTEPTPGLKSAVSRPASKLSGILKKTVTFEEPEKENMLHPVAKKAKTETNGTTTTGMRAKPVRKPTTSGRTTRASARAAATEMTEKKPLSPKKDGQNRPLSRDAGSDDELATYEKTPLKPLMKSPIKPASGVKKLEFLLPEKEKDENSPPMLEPTLASVLSSPARRPPPSPFKDTMKSPAKRVDAIPSLAFPSASTEAQGAQSPAKSAMLQSPAKRPHMSLQAFQLTQDQMVAPRSPTKMSLLNTPAKRPASPMKLLGSPVPQAETEHREVAKEVNQVEMEEIDEEQLQSQIRAENCVISPPEPPFVAKTLTPIQEADQEESINLGSPTPQLPFPGRLSAILPRHADPALKQNPLPAPELPAYSPQLNIAEPEKSTAAAVSRSLKDELDAEGLVEGSMNICDTMPEEPHNSLCSVESDEGSTYLSDVQPADECEESFGAKAGEQPLSAEVSTPERHTDADVANSKEKPTHVSEPKSKSQSMNECNILPAEQPDFSPPESAPSQATPKPVSSGLQEKDQEDGNMSESEDELAFSGKAVAKFKDNTQATDALAATPAPLLRGPILKIPESAARAAQRAIRSVANARGRGYTPLSVQLGAWRASSPIKARQAQQKADAQTQDDEDDEEEYSLVEYNDPPAVETPAPRGFFDDEMRIRADMGTADMETQAAMEAYLEADIAAKFDKHDFNDLGLMSEDLSMVTEDASESLIGNQGSDRAHLREEPILHASQDNANDNSAPIDPSLISTGAGEQTSNYAPATPMRTFASREVHTVSKVPLKRGHDSPIGNAKRHCSTTSKASAQRSTVRLDNMFFRKKDSSQMETEEETTESGLSLATPSKPTPWSSMGTPARTARPDLDPMALHGAIVFVDVHTTEGSDAGRVFVDLLIQMGARCVKSWPWNPSSTGESYTPMASTSAAASSINSKIGITHVVFKDGGKRTLEKVNASNGAVKCVGVSWVLDCEKENQWLDEKDYRVDTSLVPRGGQNRRKSMEPKAIANKNGTLVTPMKVNSGPSREPQTVPNNYMSRRDSTIWMRSPSEQDNEDEDAPSEPSPMDWESTDALILTPMPQTPAPEMVARFAMGISPSTPTTGSFNLAAGNNPLLQQTCPPRPSGLINPIGQALVDPQQDPLSVRLENARRRSMQFAPKSGSPLKKQWRPTD
ncbi:hypothetical protein F4825DRAFT_302367 [Nemania diffusa]|nr:hypothetical protein F4825DRAFT_302367 [Nemania diffusa]